MLVGIDSEPACRISLDPAPGSAWLLQQRLVGILIHAWLPVPEGAPNVSFANGGSQGEEDAFCPPEQNTPLLLCLQAVNQARWQVANTCSQCHLQGDAAFTQIRLRSLRMDQRLAHLLVQREEHGQFVLLPSRYGLRGAQQYRLGHK